jgi:hypothetical protein
MDHGGSRGMSDIRRVLRALAERAATRQRRRSDIYEREP